MRQVKAALVGTPDQVRAEIEALRSIYDSQGGELEWFGWYCSNQGFKPWEEEQRQLEYFAEHVIRHFR